MWHLRYIVLLVVVALAECVPRATSAEVRVRLSAIYAAPVDVVIHPGDLVTWQTDGYGATLEGFDDEFSTGIIEPYQTFSRKYEVLGIHPYRHVARGDRSPYDLIQPYIRSYGTIEVVPPDTTRAEVFVSSPVAGARFGAYPDGNGGILRAPVILVQAAVRETNGVERVEFLANGVNIGMVTNWPYEITWFPSTLGPFGLAATRVGRSGEQMASEIVPVSVQGLISPVFVPPRRIREGLWFVEFTAPPINNYNWILNVSDDVGGFQTYPRDQWGRLPVDGRLGAQFFWMGARF